VAEFGNARNPAQLLPLYAIDPYSQVQDNTAYPAVLLTTSMTDPEIPPWQSAKFAARLIAASTSGRPVLLDVPADLNTTAAARDAARADEMSFLLWQVGAPGFQPGAVVAAPEKPRRKHRK
jgi:prolyl oligopeptidase